MKHIFHLLLFTIFLAAACAPDQNQGESGTEAASVRDSVPAQDFLIVPGERIGLVTVRSTEARLREAYGPRNVQIRSISLGEGEEREGLVVFPDQPNELEIVLNVAADTGHPHFVRISREDSDWHTAEGVRVGSSLKELQEANGKPFRFNGFEWDLAGLVTSWNGGRYSANFVVALTPGNPDGLRPEWLGETQLSSDDPALEPLEARVGSIVVTF